jgi:xanthine phosphoribosyltransferase
MERLEQEIIKKGKVLPGGVLKVGSFLNQQMDVKLLSEMAKSVYERFKGNGITKVLTVEASGIAFAVLVAEKFGVDAVFAKKSKTANVDGGVYTADCYSYTHKKSNVLIVPEDYLDKDDKIIIVDDFLANGEAVRALKKIVEDAKATLSGVAICVEKGFQGGGDELRKDGIDVYSLAIVDEMGEDGIKFRKD